MFSKLAYWIIQRNVNRWIQEAYQSGIEKGFNLGVEYGRSDHDNMGTIFPGVNILMEAEKILRQKEF